MSRPLQFELAMLAFVAIVAAGCQQKMADQPSLRPDEAVSFLPQGTASQYPVEGTVARGHLRTDLALFTGRTERDDGVLSPQSPNVSSAPQEGARQLFEAELQPYSSVVDEFPIPITEQVIEHGRNRYMIYCVVCHDVLGTGFGKIVERGYTRPPSYHIPRLRDAPVGHLYRVIAKGYGSMPSYGPQIPVRDRWAIVAYIRALQLSQHCPKDVPTDLQQTLSLPEQFSRIGGPVR